MQFFSVLTQIYDPTLIFSEVPDICILEPIKPCAFIKKIKQKYKTVFINHEESHGKNSTLLVLFSSNTQLKYDFSQEYFTLFFLPYTEHSKQ